MGCNTPAYSFVPETNIPGWHTTDSNNYAGVTCSSASASNSYLIEMWSSGFLGFTPYHGNQLAEINAYNAAFLYQNICVLKNESIPFTVNHLRRATSGTGEQMVAELQNSAGSVISTGSIDTANNAWKTYKGTLTNNSISGSKRYGFRAITGGAIGNLIDQVTIYLKPLVDVHSFSATTVYETDSNYLKIYVNGTLNDSATVIISKTGTATYGSDFLVSAASRGLATFQSDGSIKLKLPPGDYDPNKTSGSTAGLISFKFNIKDEGYYESNETVVYTITSSQGGGGGDTLWNLAFTVGGQSAGCTNAITTAQFMIIDAVALPVTLIEFNAEEQSGYNYLNWVVAEEENVQKYIVEYGHNGKDFAVVAEISYDVTAGSSYFYNHLVAEDVVSYYRLSVADINGNITPLSQVKGVNQSIFSTFNIYPNPGKGAFTANFTSSKQLPVSFIVTDAFGKTAATLETLAVKGNNNIVFDLAGKLENGMYFVTYNYGTSKGTVKISIIN